MNHDDPPTQPPDLQPFIDPALEARVVAWVLGEASAFEAAELERLCAEQPELAIFHRRIAAVHGLTGKALRPEMQLLRLAPERRERILQTISAKVEKPIVQAINPKRPRERRWIGGLAAGLAIGGILAVLALPGTRLLEETFNRRPLRPNPSQTMIGGTGDKLAPQGMNSYNDFTTLLPSPGAALEMPDSVTYASGSADPQLSLESRRSMTMTEERKAFYEAALKDPTRRREVGAVLSRSWNYVGPPPPAPEPAVDGTRLSDVEDEVRMLRGNGPDDRPAPMDTSIVASPPPPASSPAPSGGGGYATTKADGTISLSPFEVSASADTSGYTASTTLAGTRIRTDLRDIGSAISVVTREQFLKDTAAISIDTVLDYAPGTEVGGLQGNYAGRGDADRRTFGAQNWSPDFLPNEPEARPPNSLMFGIGPVGGVPEGDANSYKQEMPAARETRKSIDEVSQLGRLSGLDDEAKDRDAALDLPQAILAAEAQGAKKSAQFRAVDEKNKNAAAPDEVSTAVEPVSTFSLHVSDVSFRLAQAALARGEVPDPARIRPEEFYNAFDYGDPAASTAEKIACRIEQAAHPVLQQRNLVRIAVRVPATGRGAGQPLRLTVLLDTSGSMEREDRAASVRRALDVLASLLGPNDRVTVIGFARTPRLLVEALPGDQAAQLGMLAAQTPAEGGTNLEAALQLALTKAHQYFDAAAQNRVVLITDGAANLGNAEPERLAEMITVARQQGLAFDACGVGTDGLDDAVLEALTRKGDGRYYVLDSPEDADAGFARQLAGAFRPAAQNVKLQVRFNPARVAHYRLIGFEQHRLREEDFRNDKVDAAELAAEEAAVAVYQVEVLPEGEGELGDVFVRFRDTAANEMVERSWTMPFEARARAFDQATPTVQLAGVAALLAEKLRGGAMADLVRLDELAPVMNALRGRYAGNARVQELVTMVEQARRIAGE